MFFRSTLAVVFVSASFIGCKPRSFNEKDSRQKSVVGRTATDDELSRLKGAYLNDIEVTKAYECVPVVKCWVGDRDSGAEKAGTVLSWKKALALKTESDLYSVDQRGVAKATSTKTFFSKPITTAVVLPKDTQDLLNSGKILISTKYFESDPVKTCTKYADLSINQPANSLLTNPERLEKKRAMSKAAWAICTSKQATSKGIDAVRYKRGSEAGYVSNDAGDLPQNAANMIVGFTEAKVVRQEFCYKKDGKDGFSKSKQNVNFENLPPCLDYSNQELKPLTMPGEKPSDGDLEPLTMPGQKSMPAKVDEEPEFLSMPKR